ncbi:MAG: endonuclease III domain-containing protein, partial [Chloroflexota bacterium]
RCAGLANQKAPRIKGVLQQIDDQRGTLALDFLAAMSIKGAMEWLRRLPGVGQTTAACVLLFGLGRPVMPVDSGILRIARRLGLVPPWGTPDDVQQALQASVPPTWIYTLHLNLTRFGRELCVASRPRCEVCPVNDRCAYFQVTHRAPLIAARGAESGWTR